MKAKVSGAQEKSQHGPNIERGDKELNKQGQPGVTGAVQQSIRGEQNRCSRPTGSGRVSDDGGMSSGEAGVEAGDRRVEKREE